MEKIAGITNGMNSCSALLEKGNIKYALEEERLDRIKNSEGFPTLSLMSMLKGSKTDARSIKNAVIVSHVSDLPSITPYLAKLFTTNPFYHYWILGRYKFLVALRRRWREHAFYYTKKFLPNAKISCPDHHLCHAASAHFTSGTEKNLVVTADAYGDKYSNGAYLGNGSKLETLYCSPEFDSLGFYYGRITIALGFKWNRHEGKITGLAAYGKYNKKLVSMMQRMIRFDRKRMQFKSKIGKYYLPSTDIRDGFKAIFSRFRREDVAFAVQYWLEEVVKEYMTALLDEYGPSNVALAGGVFSNVKLNQKVKELDGVRKIFVHPAMSDAGLTIGGALLLHNKLYGKKILKLNDVYFGPEYSDSEIKAEIDKWSLKYSYEKDIEMQVAELLAKGKVVARFNGRMEYGPRALGNRTLLYQTQDKSVNDWLNRKLKRTEFMPFAPVTIAKYANKCYKNVKGAEYTAKFMTITFDCTEWMKENCPGVVHLDGTARPQLIDKKTNPSYFKIVDEYRKITGIPSLINTSFNMHEEPIVCSPEDAIRSFKQGHLDYLAIGNYLVKNK